MAFFMFLCINFVGVKGNTLFLYDRFFRLSGQKSEIFHAGM
jgi:hypothetical protein